MEIIEEKYVDIQKKEEKLLKKTINSFNEQGKVVKQDFYGSDNKLLYSEAKEYNEEGDLSGENDREGNRISYTSSPQTGRFLPE